MGGRLIFRILEGIFYEGEELSPLDVIGNNGAADPLAVFASI